MNTVSLHASVPRAVLDELVVDDMVVVRPAGIDMTMDAFVDIVERRHHNASLFSAYLEYTSMDGVLAGDISL